MNQPHRLTREEEASQKILTQIEASCLIVIFLKTAREQRLRGSGAVQGCWVLWHGRGTRGTSEAPDLPGCSGGRGCRGLGLGTFA
jgi:hypothetical protein